MEEPASDQTAASAVCSEPLFGSVSEQQLVTADGLPSNPTEGNTWLVDWNKDGFDDWVIELPCALSVSIAT